MNLPPPTRKGTDPAPARKRAAKKRESHFPDEIVTDILTRVPAEDVLRFRSVCHRFNELTSTQSFEVSHIKHCLPMILVVGDKTYDGRRGIHLSDKWWEIHGRRKVIHRFTGKNLTLFTKFCLDPDSAIRFSLNGFIVSDLLIGGYDKKFLILNPTNRQHVIISIESHAKIQGVYFHPLLKEYCTLWMVSDTLWSEHEDEDYRVLNLGPSNPCWKKIKNLTGMTSMTYTRVWAIAPVAIDNYLYWVVKLKVDEAYDYYDSHRNVSLQINIMEFDTISDELKLMPCPVVAAFKAQTRPGHRLYCNANLLNLEGCLSVVQINRREDLVDNVDIWTLRDRVAQSWEFCSYKTNLDMYPKNFQFENRFSQAICAVNGLLAIKSGSMLVVYNLKGGTMRILGKKKYDTEVFFSHLVSFASLKNCKTDLHIDTSQLRPPDMGRDKYVSRLRLRDEVR